MAEKEEKVSVIGLMTDRNVEKIRESVRHKGHD
jgi:hypothetical protein